MNLNDKDCIIPKMIVVQYHLSPEAYFTNMPADETIDIIITKCFTHTAHFHGPISVKNILFSMVFYKNKFTVSLYRFSFFADIFRPFHLSCFFFFSRIEYCICTSVNAGLHSLLVKLADVGISPFGRSVPTTCSISHTQYQITASNFKIISSEASETVRAF